MTLNFKNNNVFEIYYLYFILFESYIIILYIQTC